MIGGIRDWLACTVCRTTTLHLEEDGVWRCEHCGHAYEPDDEEADRDP